MRRYSFMQNAIPAAIFIALEGLYAAPVIAGDGVIVLQREVPVRPAYREGFPGRATSIDVSPDDKVKQAVGGQQSSLKSTELGDADFAAISTDTPQEQNITLNATNAAGLTNTQLSSHGLNGAGSTAGTVQSIAPTVTGAVGGATGHLGAGVAGATGALSGLTGAIMRSSGQ